MFKYELKKYLVTKLESEFYTTKNLKFKFFWKYLPSTMFWKCILGPQQIFNILTLFLFTLKADCTKKWTFSSLVNLNPLKIKHFSNFFLYIRVQNWRLLMLSKQNKAEILIFSYQICPRVDGYKNLNIFYIFSRNPIKLPIFELFILKFMYRMEWILCFKKNLVKIL